MNAEPTTSPFTAFLIAGEESGDQLGAGLMQALSERLGVRARFLGVGGHRMTRLGLKSLFPMEEVALHGITEIIANLARIVTRQIQTARAAVAAAPDVVVIIDCPGFNLGVARRVRKSRPTIPIVQYVSPSVWVWRPGRARRMLPFVDQIMAIMPFEPEVHRKLGGPPCDYVGHPLVERFSTLRPVPGERRALTPGGPVNLLVLPGSRKNELRRLIPPFGETLKRIVEQSGPLDIVLPAVPRYADEIRARVTAEWPIKPRIVSTEEEKFAAFRQAHAALAASGTVTLELALSGVPMVVAYRVDPLVKPFKWALSRINSFVLPNLILGENPIPEFLDEETSPERLSAAVLPLLRNSAERRDQVEAFAALDTKMALENGSPSGHAADLVLKTIEGRRFRKTAETS